MSMLGEHQLRKVVFFFIDVVVFLSLVENAHPMDFVDSKVDISATKVISFGITDNQNKSFFDKLLRMKQNNLVEKVVNEENKISSNILTQSFPRIEKVFQKRSASKDNETLFLFGKTFTTNEPSVHPIVKPEKSDARQLRSLRKANNKTSDVEITVRLTNWDDYKNVTNQLIEEVNRSSVTENISIDYVSADNSAVNVSYVFSEIFNSTLIEGKNNTKVGKDAGKSGYTLYELQMIKVGVLCGVLTLLLLSTCRMLLKVLARHVDREKSYAY